jgi:NADH-quinone oxidoreductase subunit C
VSPDEGLLASFRDACGVDVSFERDGAGVLVVDVPVAVWEPAARHVRDVLEMDFLDWLSAVDEPEGDPAGVDVVLHVASTGSAGVPGDRARYLRQDFGPAYVQRVLLRTRVPDAALSLASLTALWPGVAWHERETFEMFGVDFAGFDDGSGQPLRPLLLPEGFEGTPLRKSFVLAARVAKPWPGAKDPADGADRPARPGARPARPRRKNLPPGVPADWGPDVP